MFFRFADEPNEVYQGENIRLKNQVVEIRLESVPDGNYGLRRVD